MTVVRTLPIRVAPIDGEALDSWLEAIAHRTHTAFGDVLSAAALTRNHDVRTGAWMVRLEPDQVAAISEATGISEATIHTMTMAHYAGRALRINPDTGTVSRAFPWGRGIGSRFCPMCLDQTGGRWQLAWRLGWAFACTIHNCLLADACPHCGAVQRRRTHVGDIIPQPGRCAHPATDATGRAPTRCHADLTATPVASFDTNHAVICAQRIVNTIIDTETPRHNPAPTCWPTSGPSPAGHWPTPRHRNSIPSFRPTCSPRSVTPTNTRTSDRGLPAPMRSQDWRPRHAPQPLPSEWWLRCER
jgi:hypothetical protein